MTVERLSVDLAWLVLALAMLVFGAVVALLVVAAERTPRDAPPEPRRPGTPRYHLSRGWELAWTLLPALALLLLGLLSAQALLAGQSGRP